MWKVVTACVVFFIRVLRNFPSAKGSPKNFVIFRPLDKKYFPSATQKHAQRGYAKAWHYSKAWRYAKACRYAKAWRNTKVRRYTKVWRYAKACKMGLAGSFKGSAACLQHFT